MSLDRTVPLQQEAEGTRINADIDRTIKRDFAERSAYEDWAKGDTHRVSRRAYESSVLDAWRLSGIERYFVPGYCVACSRFTTFLLDDLYSASGGDFARSPKPATALLSESGRAHRRGWRLAMSGAHSLRRLLPGRSPGSGRALGWQPNWRERLACVNCHMNNRTRASIANLSEFVAADQPVWIAEQTTPLYRFLAGTYTGLIGSEFLGPDVARGTLNERAIRHEDCTAVSFPVASLAAVLSFDVLEHIPDYRQAISEAHRILRPGGVFFWSAPFMPDADTTVKRALRLPDGSIQHLLPAEFHGDPVNPAGGILAFQQFGWDVLDDMRDAGFNDVRLRVYWSVDEAVIGPEQLFVVGRR